MDSDISRDSLAVPEASIREACGDTPLPELGVIEQVWETDPIPTDETADRAGEAFASLPLEAVPDGGEIALGVGSRGIANLAAIVGGVVAEARERGYEPFVFPAMGSHGGATAEGQRETLAALGITEERLGCEIRSSMDTEHVGTDGDDRPVYVEIGRASGRERV